MASMFGLLGTPSTVNFKLGDAFAAQQRMQASAPTQAQTDSFASQQRMQSSAPSQPQPARGQQFQASFVSEQEGSPVGTQSRTKTPLSEMTPIDRWGLKGLLETIRSDDLNVSSLAIGHDLTTLGLDLNSQESVLQQKFSDGHFANALQTTLAHLDRTIWQLLLPRTAA